MISSAMMKRRDFLKKAGVATAGTLAWLYLGEATLAQVRWEEELETVRMDEVDADFVVSPKFEAAKNRRSAEPRLTIDNSGQLWVVWVEEREKDDEGVYTAVFNGEEFVGELRLNPAGTGVLRPAIASAEGGVYITWFEKAGSEWKIKLARVSFDGSAVSVEETSSGSFAVPIAPTAITVANGKPWVAFTGQTSGEPHANIHVAEVTGNEWRVAIVGRGEAGDCLRPAITTSPEGDVWVAWDHFEGPGKRNVYIARMTGDGNHEDPIRITNHPALDISPDLDIDEEGRIWVAYQSNRRDDDKFDIPRWIYLTCYDGGRIYDPVSLPTAMNLDKEGTDQSFEFPRVLCARDGKVFITGRPAHNFCIQWYQGSEWSELYRLPEDGWGGRGKILDIAADKDGTLWVVRRDIGINVLQKITGLIADQKTEPKLERAADKNHPPAVVNVRKAPLRWDPLEEAEGQEQPLNIYYGDIHGHTWMSDGVGDVDEYYITKRDYYELDFAALTDHDTFVGQSILPSEWELIKIMTQRFHEEGRFVTLCAQEWTTARYPTNAGHKCIYTVGFDTPLMDHDYPEYRRTPELYEAVRKWKGLIFPHHTGWTGTDWENFDPEIQTLGEMCSNHGVFEYPGNGPIPHRGNAKGCFIQDGLAMGHKFGFIGSSDSHGLIWHHHAGWRRDCNKTGFACVLAPELTREAIFEAMRKRRTFATTGVRPRLDFRVDNHLMGDEFVTENEKVRVSINIQAQEDIRWITIVKNNRDIYRYGGDGYTTRFSLEDDLEPGTSYYYARIEFEGPDMAWSSPVWATRLA